MTLLSVLPPPEIIPIGPLNAYVPIGHQPSEADVARIRALFDEISSEHTGVRWSTPSSWGP